MKTINTILREDFGSVDREMVRTELLRQNGICGVYCSPARNGLVIEYDAAELDYPKLLDIMCRAGVFPVTEQYGNVGPLRIGDG